MRSFRKLWARKRILASKGYLAIGLLEENKAALGMISVALFRYLEEDRGNKNQNMGNK